LQKILEYYNNISQKIELFKENELNMNFYIFGG